MNNFYKLVDTDAAVQLINLNHICYIQLQHYRGCAEYKVVFPNVALILDESEGLRLIDYIDKNSSK